MRDSRRAAGAAVVFTVVLVILPNVARVILVSGSPRFTQLKALNSAEPILAHFRGLNRWATKAATT